MNLCISKCVIGDRFLSLRCKLYIILVNCGTPLAEGICWLKLNLYSNSHKINTSNDIQGFFFFFMTLNHNFCAVEGQPPQRWCVANQHLPDGCIIIFPSMNGWQNIKQLMKKNLVEGWRVSGNFQTPFSQFSFQCHLACFSGCASVKVWQYFSAN